MAKRKKQVTDGYRNLSVMKDACYFCLSRRSHHMSKGSTFDNKDGTVVVFQGWCAEGEVPATRDLALVATKYAASKWMLRIMSLA